MQECTDGTTHAARGQPSLYFIRPSQGPTAPARVLITRDEPRTETYRHWYARVTMTWLKYYRGAAADCPSLVSRGQVTLRCPAVPGGAWGHTLDLGNVTVVGNRE